MINALFYLQENGVIESSPVVVPVPPTAIEFKSFSIRYLPRGRGMMATICVANLSK
jgi:hypothetical protein